MITELLNATEFALNGGDEYRMGRCPEFIEEWVPKIVSRIEQLEKQLAEAKTLAAFTEAELLEAQAKIKELEDV